jgi:hypothetical protein
MGTERFLGINVGGRIYKNWFILFDIMWKVTDDSRVFGKENIEKLIC